MRAGHDVFISYSSADKSHAFELKLGLESQGITAYAFNNDMIGGANIVSTVSDEVRATAVIVPIVSPRSAKSSWVHYEIGLATGLEVRMIPLLIGKPKDLPSFLRVRYAPTSVADMLAVLLKPEIVADIRFRRRLRSYREGRTLMSSAIAAGLGDIELRQSVLGRNTLPPNQVYETAQSEVVIMGVSLYRTLDQDISFLERCLQRSVKVKLLLLDPASPDVEKAANGGPLAAKVRSEIVNAHAIAIDLGSRFPEGQLSVRFLPTLSPYTGLLIDSDVEAKTAARDDYGFVRVQCQIRHGGQYVGAVLEFHKSSHNDSPFEMYARDFRITWQEARGDLVRRRQSRGRSRP